MQVRACKKLGLIRMTPGEALSSFFRPRLCVDRMALQNSRLLDHARKVRDRLFIDDRRLSLSWLPDFR